MTAAPPGGIGMGDLWKQGQNTQERLAKLEVIVERLAKVDERLDSHSSRLRMIEGATIRQEGDAADIRSLDTRVTTLESQLGTVGNQVSRFSWLPTVVVGVIGAGGATLLARLINGG
ncbi:hypothetical protein G7068_13725 [Leucobacter viscericola]|uniref:Uncharacterized protein n=1 Tax=Leucobacter viscericola TaxID=2714935 RepID=A0A6G7XIE5_9MICO|nr:hypothetical protein [Leucobacter viscericola]QIK64138.1 hypothetical protein G7068_13725 [Leucobacter viscericola]